MNELISVIIPVYRVEAYLPACVESVLAQTFTNIEVILVDDGSPDNCPRMCDDYAARDPRIRVIHKENGGLSSARNAGIDAANGDFLAFLDSDDLWSPVFLARLHQALTETGADFAVCRFLRFFDAPIPEDAPSSHTECLTQQEAFECLFTDRNENMVVAPNKLYRRALFKTLRYPTGRLHEDEAVIHELIGVSEKIAWIDEVHYFYRQSPNSITTAKFSLKRLDEIYAKEQRIAYFESRGMQDLAERTKIVYLSNLMRLYRSVQNYIEDGSDKQQALLLLHRRFCEIYSRDLLPNKPFLSRLRCMLFKQFPEPFSTLEYARLQKKGLV